MPDVRVMLDTNVLVSALIFPNRALDSVMEIASSGENELVLATYVIDELRDVVARKWPQRAQDAEDFIMRLSFETVVTPLALDSGGPSIRDPKDYPVLYSAILASVDVLVTGDKDFSDVEVDAPEILTPSEFVERHAG